MIYKRHFILAFVFVALFAGPPQPLLCADEEPAILSDGLNSVTIREDARLSKKLTLGPGVKSAGEWAEAVLKGAEVPLTLPDAAMKKELFLSVKEQTLHAVLDALGSSLRLQWNLTSAKAVFESLPPSDRLDDLAESLPKQAQKLLALPEQQRGLQQFTSAGELLNKLPQEDLQALGSGRLVDLSSLTPATQQRAMVDWFVPALTFFEKMLVSNFDPSQGYLALSGKGGDYQLKIEGIERPWVIFMPKGDGSLPFDPATLSVRTLP